MNLTDITKILQSFLYFRSQWKNKIRNQKRKCKQRSSVVVHEADLFKDINIKWVQATKGLYNRLKQQVQTQN